MTLNVSSWFIDQAGRPGAAPKRIFTVGGSDYSSKVRRWPKLRYKAGTVDLGTISLTVSNRDREFLFFVNSGLSLTTSCELALAFTHPDSGEERVSLYLGEPSGISFADGGMEARLQLQGKTKRLTDVSLGTDTESGGLDFTGSAYYPSDLAWTLVTCHGGMSSVASSSNPDIVYGKWLAWRNLDVIRDVRVKGFFTGEKVYRILNTLAFMDSMVILFRNSKLDFTPIVDGFGSSSHLISPDHIIDLKLGVDPNTIVNEYSIETTYDVVSKKFQQELLQVNSRSREDFGKRSGRFGSKSVWFSTFKDAKYLAEDTLRFHQKPATRLSLISPLAGGVHLTVGDVITVPDSVFQLQQAFRITELGIDLGRGRIELKCEQADQRPWHFQETVSSEDLRVRTITAAGSGTYFAIDETVNAKRAHRTDGGGKFQPLDVLASAVTPISDAEVLFGGPPSSGSPHAVIQRSSNGGMSTVTVSSLTPEATVVHEIFQVQSGTFLASASSGSIWRSTDAGSSWNLTMTISPAYHVHRFFRPNSGAIWAGTGFDVPALTSGAHIWESMDDGVSWVPKHSVIGSGNLNIQGFFSIDDTSYLLSTDGSTINELKVFRARYDSVDSIAWVPVLEQIGFSELIRTSSGHLLFGFYEETTLNGGSTYRSLDQGSSWFEDARIAKQGNTRLIENQDGTIEAFTSRILIGERTDRHRNFDPNRID